MHTSWADELCNRKLKRDGSLPPNYKQDLIRYVEAFQSGPEHMEGRISEEDQEENRKRLIGLKFREDEEEETVFQWKQKGITIEADYGEPTKITNVKLEFSPEEWVGLFNTEGEFLPSCCGNISRIRDILFGAIRENCFVGTDKLEEMAFLIKDHDCVDDYDDSHPLKKIVNLFEIVKDDCRKSRIFDNSFDTNNPGDCLEALSYYVDNYANHQFDLNSSSTYLHTTAKANCQKALIDLVPIIKTLYHKLDELNAVVSGFGVVSDDGKLGYSRNGLQVYEEKKMAEKICQNWNKSEFNKIHYTVKPVKISLKGGVEIG